MGFASASAFATVGGSQSRGNLLCACETLSLTSLAAVSRSTESSNSTVILLDPWLLTLVRVRTPGMPLIDCSRGSVICVSITSEFAPGYDVLTDIMAGSTLGNSRIPRNDTPTTPNRTITMANTVARTGRFILVDDRLII